MAGILVGNLLPWSPVAFLHFFPTSAQISNLLLELLFSFIGTCLLEGHRSELSHGLLPRTLVLHKNSSLRTSTSTQVLYLLLLTSYLLLYQLVLHLLESSTSPLKEVRTFINCLLYWLLLLLHHLVVKALACRICGRRHVRV